MSDRLEELKTSGDETESPISCIEWWAANEITALRKKVEKQSAALKLARDAVIAALSDDQPYIDKCKEAIAAIDSLGEPE